MAHVYMIEVSPSTKNPRYKKKWTIIQKFETTKDDTVIQILTTPLHITPIWLKCDKSVKSKVRNEAIQRYT